ncbi:MAG: calcium-binding protein [Cyanobacteria bacterium P01_D01_bin.73]
MSFLDFALSPNIASSRRSSRITSTATDGLEVLSTESDSHSDMAIAPEITIIPIPIRSEDDDLNVLVPVEDRRGLSGERRNLNSIGTDGNDVLTGTAFNDTIFGGNGDDFARGLESTDILFGNRGSDSLFGNQGNDSIFGGMDGDFLLGGRDGDIINGNLGNDLVGGNLGNDSVFGGRDNDSVFGGQGDDLVFGDLGDDLVSGDLGRDTLFGGPGRDRFVLRPGAGDPLDTLSDVVADFERGIDIIELGGGLSLSDVVLEFSTADTGNTVVRQISTGEALGVIRGVFNVQLTGADFGQPTAFPNFGPPPPGGVPAPPAPPTPPAPTPPPAPAVLSSVDNPNSDPLSGAETLAQLTSRGNAIVSQGTTSFVAGFNQVNADNQDPRLARFDNGNLTWLGNTYENTGADSRAHALLWNGANDLYAVFTIDGTQGTVSQDFRRFATNGWLNNYGIGGGPRAAVLARLDAATGNIQSATYLRAQLGSGRTNTLTVDGLNFDASGNIVVNATTAFSPLRVDRSPFNCTNPSGFNYTLTLSPDLSTALTASADRCT